MFSDAAFRDRFTYPQEARGYVMVQIPHLIQVQMLAGAVHTRQQYPLAVGERPLHPEFGSQFRSEIQITQHGMRLPVDR